MQGGYSKKTPEDSAENAQSCWAYHYGKSKLAENNCSYKSEALNA